VIILFYQSRLMTVKKTTDGLKRYFDIEEDMLEVKKMR